MYDNNSYNDNFSESGVSDNHSYSNISSDTMENNKNNKNNKPIIIVGIILILLLIVIGLYLMNSKTYTVVFVNGNNIYTKTIKQNHVVKKPTDPKKEGYDFIGWYVNGKKYNFDSKVKSTFILKAKFEKSKEKEPKVEQNEIEQTTTVATTTKKDDKTKTNKTTVKNNSKSGSNNYQTPAPATTRAPQTAAPTTTTRAVTYSARRVPVSGSTIGQEIIYIVNNSTGSYVSGTATITYQDGHSETASIPASGKMVVGSTVTGVSNARGN